MERPVIFLDIDGVLISPGDKDVIYDCASKAKLDILNEIIKETNAKVVIISSRRYYKEERENILKAFNNNVSFMSESFTHMTRCEEITEYINDMGIEHFVVIDDNEYDYRNNQIIFDRFTNPTFEEGITRELISDIISKIYL